MGGQTLKVTRLSDYDGDIWDYRHEYRIRSCSDNHISFLKPVYQQHPQLREVVRAYLWQRKQGTETNKPVGWKTLYTYSVALHGFCKHMVAIGITQFDSLTAESVQQVFAMLPQKRSSSAIVQQVRALCGSGVAGLPATNPFDGFYLPTTIIGEVGQTKPISATVMKKIVALCLKWERNVDDLCELRKSQQFSGEIAGRLGIKSVSKLKRALVFASTAGAVLLLACTGIRISELSAVTINDLCRSNSGRWYIASTVYKFHGTGVRTQWQCGELGARAFVMLQKLSSHRMLCATDSGKFLAGTFRARLWNWFSASGFLDACKYHAHRFRRNFSRQVMHPGMLIEGLQKHMKHKSIDMTDHYLGDDAEMYAILIDADPSKSMGNFAKDLMRKLDWKP